MNRTLKLALPLSALLLLSLVAGAGAYTVMPWSKPAPPHRLLPPSFAAAGVYGGMVGGSVTIDGVSYRLRPQLQAYVLGEGLVPMMSVPIGSHVFALGSGRAETGAIWNLVVRPADEVQAPADDMSQNVHVLSDDRPR